MAKSTVFTRHIFTKSTPKSTSTFDTLYISSDMPLELSAQIKFSAYNLNFVNEAEKRLP